MENELLVQEAYYGKLPEFNQLEELLDSVIKKIKKQKNSNPNKFPEMRKIQNIFSKVFGFKKSIVYWEALEVENAYTIPMNTLVIFAHKGKDWIQKTDHGFYDTSHTSILTVYLGIGLVTLSNLTARELLACILHEIGHNFDESGYHMLNYHMTNILNLGLCTIKEKYKNMDYVNKQKERYDKQIKKENNKYYNNTARRKKESKRYLENIKNNEKVKGIFHFIMFPCTALGFLFYDVLFAPLTQTVTLAGKKSEIFADSFATAYGYGTDLITALQKLSKVKKYYNPKSGIAKFFQDFGQLQTEIFSAFNDVHGTNQERCMECKRKLMDDLKKNDFPPELKQELLNEIESLNKKYKELRSFSESERMVLCTIWRKINGIIFRGRPAIFHRLFKSNKV